MPTNDAIRQAYLKRVSQEKPAVDTTVSTLTAFNPFQKVGLLGSSVLSGINQFINRSEQGDKPSDAVRSGISSTGQSVVLGKVLNKFMPKSNLTNEQANSLKAIMQKHNIKNENELVEALNNPIDKFGDDWAKAPKEISKYLQFHGTQDKALLENAIKNREALRGTGKFGEGFYSTQTPQQAKFWSTYQSQGKPKDLGVIPLDVSGQKIYDMDVDPDKIWSGIKKFAKENKIPTKKMQSIQDFNNALKAKGYHGVSYPQSEVNVTWDTGNTKKFDFNDIFK